jgi:alpha/beta hydrolase family protein
MRKVRLTTVVAAAAALSCAVAAPAIAATPLPKVTGPIPATATSYPFGAADHEGVPEDLRKVGYAEREYLVSGKANVYDWPAPGPAVVRTPDAPYTTRILVRRPAKPSRFSGNVVVEMLNPTNLFDLNIGWAMMHEQLVRNGDAWVGITAKPISVEALKNFDPQRYAPLSFANPLALDDPRNCATVAADSSRSTENGLAWDIYSQVGALLNSRGGANPVPGVRHVYGFGYSQTGGYLYDYINAIHPLTVRQNGGRPLYDGYIVAVAGGAFVGAVPINQCVPAPPLGDPRRQFNNVGVPIIHVMSQSDYLIGIAGRRADSDALADRFRHYEMAGAGHATPDELNFAAAPADILRAGRAVPPLSCNEGPRSRFPSRIFFDAILRNLERWDQAGIAPPHADPIQVVNGAPVLDEFGNVTGGLRSPYLDVPTSTWFGTSTGASFCFIAGHEVPFDAARLQQLYPSHGAYVAAVVRDTARLVAGRYITVPDGIEIVAEAARADVP